MNNTVNLNEKSNVVHGSFQRGFVVRVLDQIKDYIEHKKAVRQLNALSDRMLRDIGIDRSDISETVKSRGAFTNLVSNKTGRPDLSTEYRQAA